MPGSRRILQMVATERSNLSAKDDFWRARRSADLQRVYHRMTGQSDKLLVYDDVRRALKAQTQIERGLHEIPLDAIVGSVGRYADFTRSFLPVSDSMEERSCCGDGRCRLAAYTGLQNRRRLLCAGWQSPRVCRPAVGNGHNPCLCH